LTIEDALSNVISLSDDEESGIRQLRGMAILDAGGMTPEQVEALRLHRNEQAAMTEAALSRSVAVNCWHHDPDESAAMWKIYASSGADIAVRSTARRLRSSLRPKSDQTIRIALVNYDDAPAKERPKLVFDSMLWKKQAYRYEQEVRALLWKTNYFVAESQRQFDHWVATKGVEPTQAYEALRPPEFLGEKVEVDLSELIQEIVVSPQIRPWQHEADLSVLRAFCMEDVTVRPSTLTDPSTLAASGNR
jgi:hypothetical protein